MIRKRKQTKAELAAFKVEDERLDELEKKMPLRRRMLNHLYKKGDSTIAFFVERLGDDIGDITPLLTELELEGLIAYSDMLWSLTDKGKHHVGRLPGVEAVEQMRKIGGNWAAYQNQAMDSSTFGHLKFLKYGEGCTLKEPPRPQLPDTDKEINWPYRYIGEVDLEKGEVL